MESNFIGRFEHEEFDKRMEEENKRCSKRIEVVEEKLDALTSITSSIQLLASNMENMLKELKSQGQRLDAIENRDGEMWRKVGSYILTTCIGLVIGYIFNVVVK